MMILDKNGSRIINSDHVVEFHIVEYSGVIRAICKDGMKILVGAYPDYDEARKVLFALLNALNRGDKVFRTPPFVNSFNRKTEFMYLY